MKRTIFLPALDRRITVGQYVAAVKRAKANPNAEFKCGLACWWPCTGREIMQQFFAGVTERINSGVPYVTRNMSHTHTHTH